MKKSTLTLSFILLIGLLIYSCAKEETAPVESTPIQLDLTSPDGFVLAHNKEELKQMLSTKLDPIFGKNYVLRILQVEYLVKDDLTNAEIRFINFRGDEKNTMYYWSHASTGEESVLRSPNPVPIPDCVGTCWQGMDQCISHIDTATMVITCSCDEAGASNSGNCDMTTGNDSTVNYSCDERCSIGSPSLSIVCQVSFNPVTNTVYCGCPFEGGSDCGTIQIDTFLPPLPPSNDSLPLPPNINITNL